MKKNTLALIMLSAISLFTVNSGMAATASGKLQVKVNVVSSCLVNTSAVNGKATDAVLDFGTVSDLTNVAMASTPTGTQGITVLCNPGTPWYLNFDGGLNAADTHQRKMSDGKGHTIDYNLYSDSGNTLIPINTSTDDKTNIGFSDTGTGQPQTKIVYGKIPSSTVLPPAGSYSDTVTINVVY